MVATLAIPGRTVRRGRMRMDLSRLRRLATCAVVVVATAACGGDSRPTTPVSPTPPSPQPQIPNVAGTYRGPLTITASREGGVLLVSLSGTMQITVVQAGAQLTISGSISIFDETSALQAVTGTVNDTGLVTFPPDSVVNAAPIPIGDDTCGTLTPAPTMLTFSGQHGAISPNREQRRLRERGDRGNADAAVASLGCGWIWSASASSPRISGAWNAGPSARRSGTVLNAGSTRPSRPGVSR